MILLRLILKTIWLIDWFGFRALTIVGYLMSNPVFTYISNTWFVNKFCTYTQLNDQTVLFQTIQFNISFCFHSVEMSNNFIWPISGATTKGQSRPGSDSNKGLLRIPQSSSTTGASPLDCLMSYPEKSLWGLIPLQSCNRYILHTQLTGLKQSEAGVLD